MRTKFSCKLIKRLFFTVICAAAFLFLNNSQVFAQKIPTAVRMQAMIKQTLLEFTNAVQQEDFTTLHANASADFQAAFTIESLKSAFQSFIDKKRDVLPVLRNVGKRRVRYSRGPLIRTESGYKILVADGSFPTVPYKTNFEMEYEWTEDAWKLLAIKVKM